MKEAAVLFNPSSGRGRSLRRRARIERALTRNGIDFDWFVSRDENHLRRLARSSAAGYGNLLVVGGDTSLQIVASEAIASNDDPALGMLGAGSSNDIVLGLGGPDLDAVCRALRRGRTRRMDVGCLEIPGEEAPILFLGTVSLGLGARVNRLVDGIWKRHPLIARGGDLSQTLAGLWGIRRAFKDRCVPSSLTLKAGVRSEEISFSLMVFANVPSYAGGMRLVPEATPFSGSLECCILSSGTYPRAMFVGLQVLRGRHLDMPDVRFMSGEAFEIASPDPLDVQYDGEIISDVSSFRVSVRPGALKVLI